jgi:sugar lactone lactonase YvrE
MLRISRISRFLSIVVILLLAAGCAPDPVKPEPARQKLQLVWPEPPDLPRFKYETALRFKEDIAEQKSKLQELVEQGAPRKPAFDKPYAVVARNGRIYVTDTKLRQVHVFDVPGRSFYRMGIRAPGTLVKPIGIALDGEMNVYVADATSKKIVVYDSLGLYVKDIGSSADLLHPSGVAVNTAGDRIYVIDTGGIDSAEHRVVVYDNEGKKLFAIGKRGTGDGEFNLPTVGAVAPDGTLYVLDAGNFRVQAFSPDGKFLRKWGRPGNEAGSFARPRGIAVDQEGRVYVTDPVFGNVQIFTPKGELLLAIGSQGEEDTRGHYGLLSGVAVDETGRVYLLDQLYRKLEVIRPLSEEEGKAMVAASRAENN